MNNNKGSNEAKAITFNLPVSSSVSAKEIVKRQKYYHGDDFYIYEIICKCGVTVGGWSIQQAEEAWEKHCC